MSTPLKQDHVILKQDEINTALVELVLRQNGLDPEEHVVQFRTSYRVVDGMQIASLVIDNVTARKRTPDRIDPALPKAPA